MLVSSLKFRPCGCPVSLAGCCWQANLSVIPISGEALRWHQRLAEGMKRQHMVFKQAFCKGMSRYIKQEHDARGCAGAGWRVRDTSTVQIQDKQPGPGEDAARVWHREPRDFIQGEQGRAAAPHALCREVRPACGMGPSVVVWWLAVLRCQSPWKYSA